MALSICAAVSANWPEYGMISPILTGGCCANTGPANRAAAMPPKAINALRMSSPPNCSFFLAKILATIAGSVES